jgi:succinyl-CoA synthetase beta subunit
MKIHEYQAKEILRRHGVPVPRGGPASTPDEAAEVATRLVAETASERLVVKAQIHAGGRGKGRLAEHPEVGGVQVVEGVSAARDAAARLIGNTLVTIQTGPAGRRVGHVLVEQGLDITRELYLGLVVDRDSRRVCVMASSEGGVEIEQVAARSPEKILKVRIDPAVGLMPFQARQLASGLDLGPDVAERAVAVMTGLAKVFTAEDASLVEINPLVVTGAGRVVALDAKVNLDDNASYRHPERAGLHDLAEEDPTESEATAAGLSYVKLEGNVGCLVNGAGLAMSTMDIIKHFGGEPANFLDVGGGASQDAVSTAFKIILRDPNVKAIFVNIFGGIVKCDLIAKGVLAAVRELGLDVPLVVRLEGTNVREGRSLLEESGLRITPATDMADGARKVVALASEGRASSGQG